MPLDAGSRLGPYEIDSPLGAGGMGEVYRARDTRLGRTVAIKILPGAVASDPERRSRFEREARVIASLHHPHICAIHDVGVEGPIQFLVMEHLDGETLAERIAKGPLPPEQVRELGAEMAEALDAAHREAIVHRDLKPANVMVTRTGVKLLDFGLAKSAAPADQADVTSSIELTTPGSVLGTLPYMSPEQVEGRPADSRSDIFALGSVLYEMASGRRAFSGDSPASVASALLTTEPPPLEHAAALDRIIRGCLVKDPDVRWQSAHDVAVMLRQVQEPRNAAASRTGAGRWLPWAAAAVIAAGSLAFALQTGGDAPAASASAGPVTFHVPPPPDGAFAMFVEVTTFALSPDGSQLAFAARASGEAQTSVWLRPLAAGEPRALAGTEGATSLFWSPDGESIAFFDDGSLKRVRLDGSAPVVVCDVRRSIGHSGTWGADGQILFASVQGDAIYRVPASGGTAAEVLKPDPGRKELRAAWPSFLPDGRRFLYTSSGANVPSSLMLVDGDGSVRALMPVQSAAHVVQPGFLLFVQDSTLMARRFDLDTGQLGSGAEPIASGVGHFASTGSAQFTTSQTGVVAFHAYRDEELLSSFDAKGQPLGTLGPSATFDTLRLTAGGSDLLFDRIDRRTSTFDIWKLELDRGGETRLTDDPHTEVSPLLDSAGRLIFAAGRGRAPRLLRRDLATGAEEELSPTHPGLQMAPDLSRDERWLVYQQRSEAGTKLHALSMADRRLIEVYPSSSNEVSGRFSPDGRHIAFVSDRSGRAQVFVAPFPPAGVPRAVGDGRLVRWSADGRRVLYLARNGDLMAAEVGTAPSLLVSRPVKLFTPEGRHQWQDFDVAPDGRFFAIVPKQYAAERPLTIVINWQALQAR